MKPFSCPVCRSFLEPAGEDAWSCPVDGLTFPKVDGIWRFLAPEREKALQAFIRDYEAVRAAEGRGSEDPAYYRSLPFRDLSGRMPEMWRMRAASFRVFQRSVLRRRTGAQRVLDLGAGNGWLSYRLAQLGCTVDAVDLLVNDWDGLGAHRHYDAPFRPIQASFDALPLRGHKYDLVVFNASFHYSTDYDRTLDAVLRRVDAGGALVILDTPLYSRAASGAQMVREREKEFTARFGFPSNALAMENYLTEGRLAGLAGAFNLKMTSYRPWYGLRKWLQPAVHRLLGRREPAQFPVIVLTKRG